MEKKPEPLIAPAPALANVGTMNKQQLNDLLKTFPPTASIERGDMVISVKTPKGIKVMSAARLSRNTWHVRAIPGLIQKNGHTIS